MTTWERRISKAKKKHRPRLKDWGRDRFASSRQAEFSALTDIRLNSSFISHVSSNDLSVENFIKLFEVPAIPCVISDVPKTEKWNAVKNWTFSRLKHFRRCYFKVGEDDKGYKVKVRMKYFLQYLKNNQDDSPLYIFDADFDEDKESSVLLTDFNVPSYFPDDLFSLVGEKRRPPYRWFLVGPKRSGTCVHIDPLGTSAWNTLIEGRKRWVLFPPGTPKNIVKGLDVIKKGEDDESIHYFVNLLPRIRSRYFPASSSSSSSDADTMIEFIQYPGDTVFVPGGWWHAVINLDDTIAVTQNYCSHANFDRVWRKTRKGRKKMAVRWLQELRHQFPHLAVRSEDMNHRDRFTMYDAAVKKKKKEKTANSPHKNEKKRKRNSGSCSNCSSHCTRVAEKASDAISVVSDNNYEGGSGPDSVTPNKELDSAEKS